MRFAIGAADTELAAEGLVPFEKLSGITVELVPIPDDSSNDKAIAEFISGNASENFPLIFLWYSKTVLPSSGVTFPFGTFPINFPKVPSILGINPATLVVTTNFKDGNLSAILVMCPANTASRVSRATCFPPVPRSFN